jgi:hypothetical protein
MVGRISCLFIASIFEARKIDLYQRGRRGIFSCSLRWYPVMLEVVLSWLYSIRIVETCSSMLSRRLQNLEVGMAARERSI